MNNKMKITMSGGPTLLIEIAGLRILTDPTFDAAGGEYPAGPFVLKKTGDPAVTIDSLGRIDVILLSHEQHDDNLDKAGRSLLKTASTVLTTKESAERLGASNVIGLNPWQTIDIEAAENRRLIVTATPARHGPVGIEPVSGAVTGFILNRAGETGDDLYVSGDTVWYEETAQIAERFDITTAILFLGAVKLEGAGETRFTMNAEEAVQAAKAFASATIIPVHWEGWTHFQEPRAAIEQVFEEAGLSSRLRWLEPGIQNTIRQ